MLPIDRRYTVEDFKSSMLDGSKPFELVSDDDILNSNNFDRISKIFPSNTDEQLPIDLKNVEEPFSPPYNVQNLLV